MRPLARLLCLICLGLVLAGFAGAVHPGGDSLATFGGLCAIVTATMLPLTGWRRAPLTLAVAICLTALMPRVIGWLPAMAPPGPLVLYQKTLLWTPADRRPLVADIRDSGAQVLTFQEVSENNLPLMERLEPRFPEQQICAFRGVGAVAVLTDLPLTQDRPFCDEGLAALRVMTPEGPLWIISLHLYWPWPQRQPTQVARLRTRLAALDGPILIAGDFNAVPRTIALRQIAKASTTGRLRPLRPTFNLPYLGLGITIDHVLAPRGSQGRLSRRPKWASDHHGLLVELDWPV